MRSNFDERPRVMQKFTSHPPGQYNEETRLGVVSHNKETS